jgi:hypothetical protein
MHPAVPAYIHTPTPIPESRETDEQDLTNQIEGQPKTETRERSEQEGVLYI